MSDAPAEIEFLTVEVVLALHQAQLVRFGGGAGLREVTEAFYDLTMNVAEGRIDKAAVTSEIERIAKSKPA